MFIRQSHEPWLEYTLFAMQVCGRWVFFKAKTSAGNYNISVEEVLKRGHVPPRHGVYVERKAIIQKIQEELYKLKDQDGYEYNIE